MEVHHHGHVHTKSKWKEYLFQFFMLFLAVFCGFLAEYRLEQTIERHREHDYAESMMNDLRSDTTRLSSNSKVFDLATKKQDSLLRDFDKIKQGFTEQMFRLSASIAGFPDFIQTDGTIQQLKNSGGFRLMRNRKVVDSILAYDADLKKMLINERILGEELMKVIDIEKSLFDYQKLDAALATETPGELEKRGFVMLSSTDQTRLTSYYNQIRYYNILSKIVAVNMKGVKARGERLLKFMEEEYD